MNPILYAKNSIDFNNLGLGVLKDAISPKVREERNGVFELELSYPIAGKLFNKIENGCFIKCDAGYDLIGQLFKIEKIKKMTNGRIEIYAQHCSYLSQHLSFPPLVEIKNSNATTALEIWKNAIVDNNPFEVLSDISTPNSTTWSIKDVQNPRQALGGVSGSILDVWGGEYLFDNYLIKLLKNRGRDRGVRIAYGKNLVDLNQEEALQNVYTSIYPYATYSDQESGEHTVTLDYPYYIDSENLGVDSNRRILPVDFSSDFEQGEAITKAKLETACRAYIKNNNIGVPKVSLTVSYVDLAKTLNYQKYQFMEKVHLCDTVTVYFEKLGIDVKAKVITTVWDVKNERYDSIEIGEPKKSLSSKLNQIDKEVQEKPSQSDLQAAVDRATAGITGNSGGYVVLRPPTNPEEILVMDTPDIKTAKKVWRWNKAGLGYSSTGYNGTYGLALTSDGEIVADFVTTGKLNAEIIKVGTIFGQLIDIGLDSGIVKIGKRNASGVIDDPVLSFDGDRFFINLGGQNTTTNLYVGGENLVRNSALIEDTSYWTLKNTIRFDTSFGSRPYSSPVGTDKHFFVNLTGKSSNLETIVIESSAFNANKESFSISCYYYLTNTTSTDADVSLRLSFYDQRMALIGSASVQLERNQAEVWKRAALIIDKSTIPDEIKYARLSLACDRNCIAYVSALCCGYGNIDKDWSPNQNDTNIEIVQVKQTSAEIQLDLDSITQRVTDVETDQITLDGEINSVEERVSTAESKLTAKGLTTTISEGLSSDEQIKTAKYLMDVNGFTIFNAAFTMYQGATTSTKKILYFDNAEQQFNFIGALETLSKSEKTKARITGGTIKLYTEGETNLVGSLFAGEARPAGQPQAIALGHDGGDELIIGKMVSMGEGRYSVEGQMSINDTDIRTHSQLYLQASGNTLRQNGGQISLDGVSCYGIQRMYGNMSGSTRFMDFFGNFTVYEGTKNRAVRTKSYGYQSYAAYETPRPYFGDIGSATIDETGSLFIDIDPIFLESTIQANEYHVFTSVYNGKITKIERYDFYFVVYGEIGTVFSWEIKAIQIDYNERYSFTRQPNTIEEKPDIDYIDEADQYLGRDTAAKIESIESLYLENYNGGLLE